MPPGTLSATNLATHHHLKCDLYLHYAYHGTDRPRAAAAGPASALAVAQFDRGLEWETKLYRWLDEQNLLMTLLSGPQDADTLRDLILMDERTHFFVTGIAFWPSADAFREEFMKAGSDPVKFGLAKPDLLEIWVRDGVVSWRIIDAKSSQHVKTSHHVQIYFYHICLSHVLAPPLFVPADTLGVWLSPTDGVRSSPPSFDDLKPVKTALLADSMRTFLFTRLPRLLAQPRAAVHWHFNPLCRGCPYEASDRARVVREGGIGTIPNVALQDARVLRQLLAVYHTDHEDVSDIEDLHMMFADEERLATVQRAYPSSMKKARRILGIPPQKKARGLVESPAVEAARTDTPQIINRRNWTLPRSEDIAVVLSLISDPATATIIHFCISVTSSVRGFAPDPITGAGGELVPALATCLRTIHGLSGPRPPTTQFFVFSPGERAALQRHLITRALATPDDDARLCVGALAEGAALLATAFQPLVLSGALLDFLGRKGARTKGELRTCLERLGLDTEGTVAALHSRLNRELERLKAAGNRTGERAEIGLVSRVVVVKREVERMLALPVPGYWDLPEACTSMLGAGGAGCPTEEALFENFVEGKNEPLVNGLKKRNELILALVRDLRRRVEVDKLLVNDARELTVDFMDLCQVEPLRKLFFMQQFEVLAKLSELWQARIEGCPDAPVLEYEGHEGSPYIHAFTLVSGPLDTPGDKDRAFYDHLLTEDTDASPDVPAEALFDDIPVAGLVFPLTRWTRARWDTQPTSVRAADIHTLAVRGARTRVVLRTYGGTGTPLVAGQRYRLSPRLVDFNAPKTLATLLELDMRGADDCPFVQLISDPRAFAMEECPQATEVLAMETAINRTFTELQRLGTEAAVMLMLKPSQRRAARRILSHRLAVVWGPPGTGKTHTISSTLLRLLEIQIRQNAGPQVIFLTAMTHAAIDACLSKLARLMGNYRSIEGLPVEWLDRVRVEHVLKGSDHALPHRDSEDSYIYAGTVFQLYHLSKRRNMEIDCVVIDEAGQLGVGLAALVLRSLSPNGRLVVAGDSEQLAPIFTAEYPKLEARLFGSILECVMARASAIKPELTDIETDRSFAISEPDASQASTIVQLTENFRLNEDLGEFVSTIYARAFKPQKSQARLLATQLRNLTDPANNPGPIDIAAHAFLSSIGKAMLGITQTELRAPQFSSAPAPKGDLLTNPRQISLALLRLRTHCARPEHAGYETHVRAEAALAAALVRGFTRACPEDTVFVATPHRIQRAAVKEALRIAPEADDLVEGLGGLTLDDGPAKQDPVVVDTVERLQGAEASFVICLFSHAGENAPATELAFLLERRRLNVAISRAKTLCILVTSDEVLRPSVQVFAQEESYKGYAFLRAFEERAWSGDIDINLDGFV